MKNQWNKKNVAAMILYAILYAVGTALVCFSGAVHPVFFVCYQITAGILLSGLIITALRRVRAFGAALCLALGMILLLFLIGDAVKWHVLPLIVMGILAEAVRKMAGYSWRGDVIATVIMSFSSFGYYGQIWLNRTYTYECALEEMAPGYGDSLMALSPAWSFPVVVVAGVVVSVLISNLTAKMFHLEK